MLNEYLSAGYFVGDGNFAAMVHWSLADKADEFRTLLATHCALKLSNYV